MPEEKNVIKLFWTDPDEAPELTDEWFEGADLKDGTHCIH